MKKSNKISIKMFIFVAVLAITSCTHNESQKNVKLCSITEKTMLKNFLNTGSDFIITPIVSTSSNNARSNSLRSSSGDNNTIEEYGVEIMHPSGSSYYFLNLEYVSDGSCETIISNEEQVLVVTKFMPGDETLSGAYCFALEDNPVPIGNGPGSSQPYQGDMYQCVSGWYSFYMARIESDLINNIICDATLPLCKSLVLMSAWETCQGSIDCVNPNKAYPPKGKMCNE